MLPKEMIMRYTGVVGTSILLSAGLFASCTCHQQVTQQQQPGFQEPSSGFHASGSKPTPQAQAQAPPAAGLGLGAKTPPAQVAAAPSPTAPAAVPSDFPKDVPIF